MCARNLVVCVCVCVCVQFCFMCAFDLCVLATLVCVCACLRAVLFLSVLLISVCADGF